MKNPCKYLYFAASPSLREIIKSHMASEINVGPVLKAEISSVNC